MAASHPETQDQWIGCVIAGKYRLDSLLGEGGMGSVWRAYNLQLEVSVALKLLRAGLRGEQLSERLRGEARAAAQLVHPSIVRVFDIGETEAGEPFIVMELLNGESLGEALARGPIPAAKALQLLLPVAEALSLAHARGLVHRDLKPDNIFLANDPLGGRACVHPKLLDFGIAKITGKPSNRETLTNGTLVGSPEYMSPEQACGRPDIDQRSDVWAFCIVLYELISGRPPFTGSNWQQVLQGVMLGEPGPLTHLPDVDEELSSLILSGLAKDREERPPSLSSLGRRLAAWLCERGIHHDVTGASLSRKWLRGSKPTTSAAAPARTTLREHSTLISVVHPGPVNPDVGGRQPLRAATWLLPLGVAAATLITGLILVSLRSAPSLGAAAAAPATTKVVTIARPATMSTPQTLLASAPHDISTVAPAPPAPPVTADSATPAGLSTSGLPRPSSSPRPPSLPVATTQQREQAQRKMTLPQSLPRTEPVPLELLNPY